MKRDIKFRGYDYDEGCWRYGCLINTTCSDFATYIVGQEQRDSEFASSEGNYEVAHETVGQFTGLLDKNGKEIYEGDIVRATNKYNGGTNIGKVYFEDLTWFGAKDYLDYINKFCLIEIISNIHDNPELLGEKV